MKKRILSSSEPSGNNDTKKGNKEMLLRLLIHSVILIAIYYACIRMHFEYVFHIYVAAGILLGISYFVYNKGFSAKGVTPEMLPDTMPMQEKLAFIEDGKQRLHKSRWVLTLLLPIILTVAVDFFYVTVLEGLLK